ncbi:LysR family transcriptional regulator [Agarivorans sp. 1_MG-2023]|uniref:LysR family transcriptional regulator n=1 Tax=Agarivorans sp. 1_MG-2023 TaxID=3062634 RepID=UPI0026E3EBA4|nr:LysR family transcriptional regulator [Agarivorans sp. 1_MG-2023]MDO6761967.1 LysR family transcriptional regulator [Agarivorans sp. 1_MG-2023]
MNYSLSQLQAFVSTVESGSFKQAGMLLNKRPQVIAKLVGALEDSCNLSLFERKVRQLVITDEGKILFRLAKRIMQDAQQFDSQLTAFDQALPNEFKVAIDNSLVCQQVTECYLEVLSQIPTIELEVLSGETLQVLDWVNAGDAELGLVFSPLVEQSELAQIDVFHFSMVEVAAKQVVTQGSVLGEQEVAKLSQIVPKFIYQLGHQEVYVSSDRNIISNNAQESIAMMLAGTGWCRLPCYIVQPYLDSGDLNEFSLEGANRIIWHGSVMHNKNKELSMAGDIFLEKAMALQDRISQ